MCVCVWQTAALFSGSDESLNSQIQNTAWQEHAVSVCAAGAFL